MNKAGFSIGLLAGVAFVFHALFDNTHAWPLIWAVLGGGVAAFLTRGGASGGFRAGGAVGLTAALVILTAGTAGVMWVAGDRVAERVAGLGLPFEGAGLVLAAMAVLALINLVLAGVSGLLVGAASPRRAYR